jgi:hypothetical protein
MGTGLCLDTQHSTRPCKAGGADVCNAPLCMSGDALQRHKQLQHDTHDTSAADAGVQTHLLLSQSQMLTLHWDQLMHTQPNLHTAQHACFWYIGPCSAPGWC